MSYDDASKVLGVSKRTVSNLLTRFRTFAVGRLGEGEYVDTLGALSTARDEGCPSDLARSELLSGGGSDADKAHAEGCARCKAWLDESRAAFGAISGDEKKRMVARIAAARSRRRAPVVAGLIAALAASLAFFMVPREVVDHTTIKGKDIALHVYRERNGQVERALSGESFHAKDRLRFEVDLPTAGHAMIVGVEAKGTIYPAFPREGVPPRRCRSGTPSSCPARSSSTRRSVTRRCTWCSAPESSRCPICGYLFTNFRGAVLRLARGASFVVAPSSCDASRSSSSSSPSSHAGATSRRTILRRPTSISARSPTLPRGDGSPGWCKS